MEGKKNKDREGKKGKNKGMKVKAKEKKKEERRQRTHLYWALNVWPDICVKSFHVHFLMVGSISILWYVYINVLYWILSFIFRKNFRFISI